MYIPGRLREFEHTSESENKIQNKKTKTAQIDRHSVRRGKKSEFKMYIIVQLILKKIKKNQGKFQIKESAPKEEKKESKEARNNRGRIEKRKTRQPSPRQSKSKNQIEILYVSS